MRYRVVSGSVGHGVSVVDPGGEIDLTPEEAASVAERGCVLALVESLPLDVPAPEPEANTVPRAAKRTRAKAKPEAEPEPEAEG